MSDYSAEIITIGDEVLAGFTINSNAAYIARQLATIGLNVQRVTTIQDKYDEIIDALYRAERPGNIVIVTGGLGPTPDDITKKSIAAFFDREMVFNEEVLEDVERFLNARGRPLNGINREQALLPKSDRVIRNNHGTAPGLVFIKKNCYYFFLPGVPVEMEHMVDGFILSYLEKELELPAISNRIIRTTGIAESKLYERVRDIMEQYTEFSISFLPRYIGVDMRFRLSSGKPAAIHRFTLFYEAIYQRIKKYAFSRDETDLQEVLGVLLNRQEKTLALAESFTGGLIADYITNVAGSSQYFLGSVTAYSNESKRRLLKVSQSTLKGHGAVSEETALEMVRGVQELFSSTCAIATTGIAGPGGATATKPVGLSFVAVRDGNTEIVREFRFGSDRLLNKRRGAVAGLEMLRRVLLHIK